MKTTLSRGHGHHVFLAGLLIAAVLLIGGLPAGRAAPARRLVVYSAAPLDFTETLKRDFEAQNPGVTVEILAGLGTEAMILRLEAEKASPGHCETFHAEDEVYFSKVHYWATPQKECGDARGAVCKDFAEWNQAWTEIKG